MGRFEIDFLTDYDERSLLDELARIAKVTGSNSVTKADIENIGRFSYSVLIDRFGSLRRALQLAGLDVQRFNNATNEELLAIVVDLWQRVLEKEGRTPQRKDLKTYGFPVSGDTIIRRFGTWRWSVRTRRLQKNRWLTNRYPGQPKSPENEWRCLCGSGSSS